MTPVLLVSLTLLCALGVQGQSTLGMRFFVTAPLPVNRTVLITLFTYNYDVGVTSNLTIASLNRECYRLHHPFEEETFKLGRHVPKMIEINGSDVIHRCKVSNFFYIKFNGTDSFGVTVMYRGDYDSAATYTAYPVGAYGKDYRLFLLREHQFYGSFFSKQSRMVYPGNFSMFHQVGETPVYIKEPSGEEDRYVKVFLCDNSERHRNDTRSVIAKGVHSSKDLAVFTGNCHAKAEAQTDKTCDVFKDAMLEMLLSTDYAAKHFIVFHVGPKSAPSSYVAAVTVNEDLVVDIYTDDKNEAKKTYHVGLGHYAEIPMTNTINTFYILNGTVVFQAYVVTSSACYTDQGTPSMTSAIPTLLFFNQYIWSIPAKHVLVEYLVLVLIKRTGSFYGFQFDDKNITISGWKTVAGDKEYSGAVHKLDIDEDVHTIISSQRRPFGCYMYGRGGTFSFLHSVGFLTAEIYLPGHKCHPTRMIIGDFHDNDCDGRFDEESSTTTDDDQDGRIGEDVIAPIQEHFSKNSKPLTHPPTRTVTELTTLDDVPEPTPEKDSPWPLLLLLVLLIPIIGTVLYFLLRKRQPIVLPEDITLESEYDEPKPDVSGSSPKIAPKQIASTPL